MLKDLTPLGWAMTALGAILAGIAIVKLSIIGYYPDEIVPYAIVALLGAGLLWGAKKWGTVPARGRGA